MELQPNEHPHLSPEQVELVTPTRTLCGADFACHILACAGVNRGIGVCLACGNF